SLSMMQASRVTFPSLSGLPPLPTVSLVSSASSTITPCSTASSAVPPVLSTSQALSVALKKFQVQTTMGFMGIGGVVVADGVSFGLGSVLQAIKVDAETIPAAERLEFFRNLRRFMRRDVYF